MSEYLKIWEPVLREFEIWHPAIAEKMIDWYPSGRNEITIKTADGSMWIFNFIGAALRRVDISENDVDRGSSESEWRERFADKLERKMKSSGISRWKLSEMTGISEVSLSKYVNCKATPSGYNIERLASALECSVSELIDIY
jgi:DNA-binding Xre family transcriptional regulator